jgi:tRNA dimethylallyltransferase
MVAFRPSPELFVIIGPTASGKSDLAMRVAGTYGGEIIAADSRTVYKGMDIGTAKPSKADQKKIPHWGLDLVCPGQRFTAYQFKKYASAKINDIKRRNKLPILVGGTGLYINAVLFDFGFLPDADLNNRAKLEAMDKTQLQQIIKSKGYKMPINSQNKRHLIRTIETEGKIGTKNSKLLELTTIIGIMPSNEVLKDRINKRVEQMFAEGVVKETKKLLSVHGDKALKCSGGIAYKICLKLISRNINLEEAKELNKTADWQYARRQRTWFKRNPYIKWFNDGEQAFKYITAQLNT